VGVVFSAASCSSNPRGEATRGDESGLHEDTQVRSEIERIRTRFAYRPPEELDLHGLKSSGPIPVLKPSPAVLIVRDGDVLVPKLPSVATGGTLRPARVQLPVRADGAFSLLDEGSDMRVEVALEDASSSPAEVVDGYAMYKDALAGGAHMFHRPRIDGTEDYIVFQSAPPNPEVRYRINLVAGVAGLRLVSNVLELLDERGTPRLRVAPPFLVDTKGERYPAQLHVEGCAVSVDPAPPWGRQPVPAGAGVCGVVVRWGKVRYPALLDPAWTTTGDMLQGRSNHTATLLQTGKVLVVGGVATGIGGLDTAEIYDPTSGTWAATGSISPARRSHTASVLPTGRVLIAGGSDGGTLIDSPPQVYDPNTGTWIATGQLLQNRTSHTATTLPSGKVLVTGGSANSTKLAQAELYDPLTGAWAPATSMSTARLYNTATLLASGLVLVSGGVSNPDTLATAELYDPVSDSWSSTGSMSQGRGTHTASVLASGKVLVLGGISSGLQPSPPDAEIYDPASGTWTATPSMSLPRWLHVAAPLGVGVLVAGGSDTTGAYATAEIFNETAGTWSPVGNMSAARRQATATQLPSGAVLIAGGEYTDGTWHDVFAAELFALQADGQTCQFAAECTSTNCVDGTCCGTPCIETWQGCREFETGLPNGTCAPVINGAPCGSNDGCWSNHCADGVCCDLACNKPCEACVASKKGSGEDGTCGPITNETDPDDECPAEGSGSCMLPGLCDGNGACATSAGLACGSASCSGNSTLQNAPMCDGAGSCVSTGTTDCGLFRCVDGACLTECGTADDCVGQSACINDKCKELKTTGAACTVSGECETDFCVDHVCCASACSGLCERCDATETTGGSPGTCSAVRLGADPDNECDPGATACSADGQCNGQGACNELAPAGTSCGTVRCQGSSVIIPICDGGGQCLDDVNKSCGAYTCNPATSDCLTSCHSNDDCAEGAVCNVQSSQCAVVNYACKDTFTVVRSDGSETSCSPYKCENGACRTLCDVDNDCASDHLCVARQCVTGQAGSGDLSAHKEDGCGCRQVTTSPRSRYFGVLALFVAAILARRKRAER